MTRNDDKNGFTIKIVIWAIKIMGFDGDKYVYIYIYIHMMYMYIYIYI